MKDAFSTVCFEGLLGERLAAHIAGQLYATMAQLFHSPPGPFGVLFIFLDGRGFHLLLSPGWPLVLGRNFVRHFLPGSPLRGATAMLPTQAESGPGVTVLSGSSCSTE